MQDLELVDIGQLMGGFTLKGVEAETYFPQQNGSRGYARHMDQPVLVEHNIMNWVSALFFPKSLKSSALNVVSLEGCFSEMRKGLECLLHMSQQLVVGKIYYYHSLLIVPFPISTSDTVPRAYWKLIDQFIVSRICCMFPASTFPTDLF